MMQKETTRNPKGLYSVSYFNGSENYHSEANSRIHALNHRLNEEFRKFFPTCEFTPIVRDVQSNRYWINQNLVRVKIGKESFDLASSLIDIINEYIKTKSKRRSMRSVESCVKLKGLQKTSTPKESAGVYT